MPRAVVYLAVLAVLSGAGTAVLAGAGTAMAFDCQEEEIHLQFAGNVYGDEGDVVEVARVAVDSHLVGATCTGTPTVTNNESMHPGSDLIISSAGTTVVVTDFESAAGKVSSTTSQLVLGETITASVRLGPHGVASLSGDTVVVATMCQPEPTTTTTTPEPTTSTTQPPVTTTTETPRGGVSAGGGSTAGGSALGAALLGIGGGLALLGALAVATRGLRETGR